MLIPVDASYGHMALLLWMHKRAEKLKISDHLKLVHIHSREEPAPETLRVVSDAVVKRKLSFATKLVDAPQDYAGLKQILASIAIENRCNKVALPESLDFINASVLTHMSCDGMYTGSSVIEPFDFEGKEIAFVRPFCLVTDDEIRGFAEANGFEDKPTGISVREDDFMAIARNAIDFMLDGSSNIKMNFFNSQFNVQKKFIGTG